ncbi:hypothetical protein [Hymenobacter metallilatus]|uniref:Uncharacterized protein n=1 Tax=Hymenobacter metallilatus TaxID=2493666 RepID=A0A428IYJ0_9BACT|nr:hypothetical protein [Hymenobacter metallilatus]RSK24179.1 hypothetical protein EI290_20580 [Hymenobacter metallilatus]
MNPLALAALAAGAFLLLKNKQSSPTTPPTTPPILPTTPQSAPQVAQQPNYLQQGTQLLDAAGNVLTAGQEIYGQIFGQTHTPTFPPTSVPTSPQVVLDKWNIPHLTDADVSRANTFNTNDAALFRQLSDTFRLYWEDIEALIGFDISQSGNTWQQVINWYRGDINRMQPTIENYNRANPARPIVAR